MWQVTLSQSHLNLHVWSQLWRLTYTKFHGNEFTGAVGRIQFRQVLSSRWDDRPLSHNGAENWEGAVLLWGVCPRVTQCGLVRGLPSYQVPSWSIQPFGHNTHGPKIGGYAPFLGGNCTVWSGPRPTSIPSGILIHPSSHLATTDIGQKFRGKQRLCPFGEGSCVPV